MTQNQIEEVQRMVNDYPKITIRTILREPNISLGSVVSILHENLNMSKVSARWALQFLIMVHRKARTELCNHFIIFLEIIMHIFGANTKAAQ